MKKAIKALWHGIKAVFTAVFEWVATLFGMNDNSKYVRVLRRVVATAFAAIMVLLAAWHLVNFCKCLEWIPNDDVFLSQKLSDDLFFYDGCYGKAGYVVNADGKKVIKKVYWTAKPLKGDSLVCYCDGDRRGYFHMRDGRVVVKPTYNHAWVFSDGLAAVEQGGRVKFIDSDGQVVIDKGFAYDIDIDGYVFHDGHCAVHESTGKHMGLIDHNGDWALAPQYERICPVDTFWIVRCGDEQAVFTFRLDTVMPMTKASFDVCDTAILATFADHTQCTYSLQGKLITESQIRNVDQLMYETREVMYSSNHERDECSDEYCNYNNPKQRIAVANCMRYEAEWGWYGLMGADGRLLTPPSYISIKAVDKDLYLCKTTENRGELLNSKGQRVE